MLAETIPERNPGAQYLHVSRDTVLSQVADSHEGLHRLKWRDVVELHNGPTVWRNRESRMMTESQDYTFSYEALDPSQIPTKPRPISPGRPRGENPHASALAKIAGTNGAQALSFTIPYPAGDDDEAERTIRRHTRWLRAGAHENNRSARVWSEIVPNEAGEPHLIRISFHDMEYTPRARKEGQAESTPEDAGAAESGEEQPTE